MGSAQHRIVVLDQLEHIVHLRNYFSVPDDFHTLLHIQIQFFNVVAGGSGRQPNYFGAQLQGSFHRHGVDSADDLVHGNAAEHSKVVVAVVDALVVGVTQVSPVHGHTLMGFDDNGSGSHPHCRIGELKVVVSPVAQIRIGMHVHVDNALQRYFVHVSASSPCKLFLGKFTRILPCVSSMFQYILHLLFRKRL